MSVFETCAIIRVKYFGSIMQTFVAEESFGVALSRMYGFRFRGIGRVVDIGVDVGFYVK